MTHEDFLAQIPELIRDYKPSDEVLQHISSINLCMLVGPSGAGKTTIIQRSGLHFVPSDTTRPRRPDEQDGVDYYFRNDYEQIISEIKAGDFVQIAMGPTDFYATRKSAYPDSGTAIIAIVADSVPVFRSLGFKRIISAFIVPPSYEEWIRRMSVNPQMEEQRIKRLHEALGSFEFGLSDTQTNLILSDDIEPTVKQLKDLLNRQIDVERETKAREIALSLQSKLLGMIG